MANDKVRLVDFETAVTATTVADVQISPDGQTIAYVTTPASKDGEFPESAIWLVCADGGAPRRFTTSEAADGAPRWSPDGTAIAFLSDRKKRGVSQLYVMPVAGGEAIRLTDHESGVVDAEWSPDGSKIAYIAVDDDTEDQKARKEAGDDVIVVERDVKRAGLWVLDVPADLASRNPDDLPEARRLSPEGLHIGTIGPRHFSWAPDGSNIATIASPSPKAHYVFNPELITVDMDGKVHELGNFEGLLNRPWYSPDGSTIAFMACEDKTPSFFSLRTIPSAGGESTVVLPGHEASFFSAAWLPDGDRLVALSQERQQSHLRVVDPEARTASPAFDLDTPGSVTVWHATPDGKRIAFARGDSTSHPDVWVTDLEGEPKKLTDLNPWTRDYDWGETRELKWTSTDGMEIEGLLILPVGYEEGQRYPLLLHIHGGPNGAWTHHLYANWHDWGQFFAQRGYAVLMPNPRGSSGRGSDFLSAIVNSYGEADWDDLITGVDYVIEQGIADPDQLVVGGWSGGGFLTNWTITHTDRFKAAVSGAGIANWVSFQGTADVRSVFDGYLGRVDEDPETHWRLSPIRYIKNATTPTLILYGEADDRVPPSQGYELYEGLKSRGVETELVLYPRQPHGILERKHQLDLLERVVQWYEHHLGRA